MIEWISVKDRLPELIQGCVLGWIIKQKNMNFLYFRKIWRGYNWITVYVNDECDQTYYELDEISHWMPLSEPPKETL